MRDEGELDGACALAAKCALELTKSSTGGVHKVEEDGVSAVLRMHCAIGCGSYVLYRVGDRDRWESVIAGEPSNRLRSRNRVRSWCHTCSPCSPASVWPCVEINQCVGSHWIFTKSFLGDRRGPAGWSSREVPHRPRRRAGRVIAVKDDLVKNYRHPTHCRFHTGLAATRAQGLQGQESPKTSSAA